MEERSFGLMSTKWKNTNFINESDVTSTVNDSRPLRIALIGGKRSGKSSFASKISMGKVYDTYYPTQRANPILFEFHSNTEMSKKILDPSSKSLIIKPQLRIVLSPVIDKIINIKHMNEEPIGEDQHETSDSYKLKGRTEFYNILEDCKGKKVISPILIEFIDTPPFNPDHVVPFLEESLYVRLDPKILHNLANEPPRQVSTSPFLVASGAGELNGHIDGYFFMYSAVPSTSPPSYGDETNKTEDTFELLKAIKGTLDDAWKEYTLYKEGWEKGKEEDFLTLKAAFRSIWGGGVGGGIGGGGGGGENSKRGSRRSSKSSQPNIDPSDPYCPPPIWIICTNIDSPYVSNQLVHEGIKLAHKWGCGFIGVDNVSGINTEISLSLMVREIIERRKLQRKRL